MPFVTEIAFGYALEGPPMRRIISGVNWSVAIGNPFRSLGREAESLDSLLAAQRAGREEPVHWLIHLASPRIDYTDRGKTAVSLADDENDE